MSLVFFFLISDTHFKIQNSNKISKTNMEMISVSNVCTFLRTAKVAPAK